MVMSERHDPCTVPDLDAGLAGDLGLHVDQSRAPTTGLDSQPTPEPEFTVDLERLAPIHRDESHTLAT